MMYQRLPVAALAGFAAMFVAVEAQDFSSGNLVVTPPTSVVTCEPATVSWEWTGSTVEEVGQKVAIAVESVGDTNSLDRRSLVISSASRLTKQRRAKRSERDAVKRGTPANLAGAASIPMTDGSWVWNSVGLEPGSYRFVVNAPGMSITSYSSVFNVQQGPDTSCIYAGAASSTASSTPVTTSSAPAMTSASSNSSAASSSAVHNTASTASNAATGAAATSSLQNAASESSHSGGLSGGKIAAAVILPLLAVIGLLCFFCFRKRKGTNDGAQDGAPSKDDGNFTEKVLAAVGSRGKTSKHKRDISAPMYPVHSAGLAMHEHAVANEMRRTTDDDPMAPNPEHWVAFNGSEDAQAVSPRNVDDIVNRENARRSQDDGADDENVAGLGLYKQGKNRPYDDNIFLPHSHLSTINEASSSNPSRVPSTEIVVVTSKPSSELERQQTAMADDRRPVDLARSASAGSTFSIRRKPAPAITKSMVGESQDSARRSSQGSTSSRILLPSPDQIGDEEQGQETITDRTDRAGHPQTPGSSISSAHGPFSDANEVVTVPGAEPIVISRWSASNVSDAEQAETLTSPRPAFLADGEAGRSSRTSEQFPASVHSTDAPSAWIPAARPSNTSVTADGLHRRNDSADRNTPAALTDVSLPPTATEEERNRAFKLSVSLDEKDRGFRISF
ncbi:hypothetical protein FA10DRAFT_268309 [Acaromyces ingoldii]|uniref:Mid2 domain-containing protein n=1 Tax=Acaromyces ingoldii TaxID=215250 RepID=A0A316YG62_9BASI|nr:hypothetical protein FA10DRAFT_268309 [Acaromyces ingoldii]PWN88086.1 hypothetical protein FA10DRAFT_268309 [Acaromyces ingoldii]